MTGPPRPPERGTPAFTATADQYAAATADAARRVAELHHAGGLLVLPGGPWADALLTSVAPNRDRRLVCAHVAHAHGPQPLYVTVPRWLLCHDCFTDFTRREQASPMACALCGRLDGLLRVVVAQRGVVIARGRLCPPCVHAEQVQGRHAPDAPLENPRDEPHRP